jgi:hypothetical protein
VSVQHAAVAAAYPAYLKTAQKPSATTAQPGSTGQPTPGSIAAMGNWVLGVSPVCPAKRWFRVGEMEREGRGEGKGSGWEWKCWGGWGWGWGWGWG